MELLKVRSRLTNRSFVTRDTMKETGFVVYGEEPYMELEFNGTYMGRYSNLYSACKDATEWHNKGFSSLCKAVMGIENKGA